MWANGKSQIENRKSKIDLWLEASDSPVEGSGSGQRIGDRQRRIEGALGAAWGVLEGFIEIRGGLKFVVHAPGGVVTHFALAGARPELFQGQGHRRISDGTIEVFARCLP